MSERWKEFVQQWVLVTLGVVVAAHIVPGIHYDDALSVLIASLLLGLLNGLRPLLAVLSLPILLLSLGLFWFIINALLLWLVGYLVRGFHVDGFLPAFLGGLVISVVSFVVRGFLGKGIRVQVQRGGSAPSPGVRRRRGRDDDGPPGGGSGPVIDV